MGHWAFRGWRRFMSAPAGERFQRQFRHSHLRNRRWRAALLVLSALLILSGLATLLVPPIPGVTLILLGAMLGARLSRRVARLCDRAELGVRRWWLLHVTARRGR